MTVFLQDIWTSFIKKIPLFLVIILVSAILGIALLTSLFVLLPTIPDEYITDSAKSFDGVGSRQVLFSWCTSELDNWTDALILQISADNTNDTALNRAIIAYHGANLDGEGSPVDSLREHYLNHRSYDELDTYPKYWHGYLLFIRPLLCIMSYSTIRIFNGIFQLLLSVLIICLFVKKKLAFCTIPYILSLLMLMPLAQAMSLQFSSCFYVFTFGAISLLLCKKQKWFPFIFLGIGIATAFFDFLTYPIATFGVPAVIALSLKKHNSFSDIPIFLGPWIIGYGGMWASKWILTELFTTQSILSDVRATLMWRTSSSIPDGSLTASTVLKENLFAFFHTPVSVIAILFLITLFVLFTVQKKKVAFSSTTFFSYILTSCLPLIWFCTTQNHSYIHSFYVNKGCVVLFFSILAAANRSVLPLGISSVMYKSKK